MKKLLAAALLAAPTPLFAQTATTLSSYVASDAGVQGTPMLVGGVLARERGWVGARLGAAASLDAGPAVGADAGSASGVGVISTEVDALLFAGSPRSGASVVPYLTAGAGIRRVDGAAGGSFSAFYSYGAGARTPLAEWLSLEAEARHRAPVAALSAAAAEEVSGGWEVRFGVNVRLSRGVARRSSGPAYVSLPSTRPSSAPAGAAAAARLRVAQRALDTADDFVGVHYTWGGNTPQEGFDCSGFIRYVYARHGIQLPRVSRDQAQAGAPVPLEISALEPGDLLAFASRGGVVDHIAIYAGEGRIIHSSSSGNGVRFDDLYSQRGRWYLNHMVAARRVIQGVELDFSAR